MKRAREWICILIWRFNSWLLDFSLGDKNLSSFSPFICSISIELALVSLNQHLIFVRRVILLMSPVSPQERMSL